MLPVFVLTLFNFFFTFCAQSELSADTELSDLRTEVGYLQQETKSLKAKVTQAANGHRSEATQGCADSQDVPLGGHPQGRK